MLLRAKAARMFCCRVPSQLRHQPNETLFLAVNTTCHKQTDFEPFFEVLSRYQSYQSNYSALRRNGAFEDLDNAVTEPANAHWIAKFKHFLKLAKL